MKVLLDTGSLPASELLQQVASQNLSDEGSIWFLMLLYRAARPSLRYGQSRFPFGAPEDRLINLQELFSFVTFREMPAIIGKVSLIDPTV